MSHIATLFEPAVQRLKEFGLAICPDANESASDIGAIWMRAISSLQLLQLEVRRVSLEEWNALAISAIHDALNETPLSYLSGEMIDHLIEELQTAERKIFRGGIARFELFELKHRLLVDHGFVDQSTDPFSQLSAS